MTIGRSGEGGLELAVVALVGRIEDRQEVFQREHPALLPRLAEEAGGVVLLLLLLVRPGADAVHFVHQRLIAIRGSLNPLLLQVGLVGLGQAWSAQTEGRLVGFPSGSWTAAASRHDGLLKR